MMPARKRRINLPAPAVLPASLKREVRSGDTLYQIAQTNKMSVEEICRINEIDDSLKITVGQRIFLE